MKAFRWRQRRVSLRRKGEQNSQATIKSPVFQTMLDRTTLTPVVAFVTRTTSSVLALIVCASVSRTWSED